MSINIASEITNLLGDVTKLSDGLSKMDPAEVLKAVESMVSDVEVLVNQGGNITQELKDVLSGILGKFQNDKNPLTLINDLLTLKEEMTNLEKPISDLEAAAKITATSTEEALSESKGIIKTLLKDGKAYASALGKNTKEFIDKTKADIHGHHGIGSLAKDGVAFIKSDIHATGQLIHDVFSNNNTAKLVDFAEGILAEVAKENLSPLEANNTAEVAAPEVH